MRRAASGYLATAPQQSNPARAAGAGRQAAASLRPGAVAVKVVFAAVEPPQAGAPVARAAGPVSELLRSEGLERFIPTFEKEEVTSPDLSTAATAVPIYHVVLAQRRHVHDRRYRTCGLCGCWTTRTSPPSDSPSDPVAASLPASASCSLQRVCKEDFRSKRGPSPNPVSGLLGNQKSHLLVELCV